LVRKAVTGAKLSRETGIANFTTSEVLAGRTGFSRQMIRKLADYVGLGVGVPAANL
jgi:plasmid maintenance system antidote protein VapI